MKPMYRNIFICLIASTIIPSIVSAGSVIDTNLTAYNSVNDLVVSTPYLDINLWYYITSIGLLLLVLSNLTSKDQNNTLWAFMAAPFLFASARFSLMMNNPVVSVVQETSTSSNIHLQTTNVIFHPEWLCILMAAIFVASVVNIWYVMTKKPIEKSTKEETVGQGEF